MSYPEYTIREIADPRSPHLPELEKLREDLFPATRTTFAEILRTRIDGQGHICKQLFAGLVSNKVAGMLQVFYLEWGNGLIANIDLVGVSSGFRGTNLGLSLLRFTKTNFYHLCMTYNRQALGIVGLTDPDHGPQDSWSVRRVRLFEKLGAQIRRDLVYKNVMDLKLYPEGKLILWYPLTDRMAHIDSKALAWILWQACNLAPGEFIKRYGSLPAGTDLPRK